MFSRHLTPFRLRLIFCALTFLGLFLGTGIPLQLFPSVPQKSLTLRFTWPKAGPEDIERRLTSPLERVLSRLPGIEEVHSTSAQAYGQIELECPSVRDMPWLRYSVLTEIRRIRSSLPAGFRYSLDTPGSDKGREILSLALYSTHSLDRLKEVWEKQLYPRLAGLPWIDQIEAEGFPSILREEFYKEPQSASLSIGKRNFLQVLDQEEMTGSYSTGSHLWRYRYSRPDEFDWKDIPLKTIENRTVKGADLMALSSATKREGPHFRFQGLAGVRISVFSRPGSNHLSVATGIRKEIRKIGTGLPKGVYLKLLADHSERLRIEWKRVVNRTMLSLFILILFSLLLFYQTALGWYLSMGMGAVISISAIFLYLAGIEMTPYGLAGIAVALVLAMDNLIIAGYHTHASRFAFLQSSLTAGTATSIIAVFAIFLLPEPFRTDLQIFAKLILIGLASTLIVARWLIP
ncbi:MAG: efflux RND transporter permease subunit, partial [Saprospiraceae bacterium]|nr:efflux RND transporter permease subunit [Saprospiraceae bacterium]